MVACLGKGLAHGCYFALHDPYVLGPLPKQIWDNQLHGLCLASHLARSVPISDCWHLLHVCWKPIGRPSLSLLLLSLVQ